ncbi:hypothetical protein GW930_00775 [Candidatus Saccharibacteria bacterium]|nr:hypothetical protein [Candidatus Saccharibacteria bacterium]
MEHTESEQSSRPENTKIPLEFRLAHLGIDIASVYPKVTAQQIADTLGVDSNLVRRPLKKYDIETETLFHDRLQTYHEYYPQYILELIREEKDWREWYLTLPERMNTRQVAEAVGRSYGWTMKTLAEMYPGVRQQEHGHRSRLYPKSSVKKLRDITFATPPDENWPTLPRLVEFTGRDREWVLNRISQTTIQPEVRRQVITGREFLYYPPDSFDALKEAMEQRAGFGGDWLTASAIGRTLGRSDKWIKKRLEETFSDEGETRIDDMGVERTHYPPSTVNALRDEIAETETYEQAGDWATISTLERNMGMHAVTLAKLMQQIEVESETRLDLKGRLKEHFSPSTQELLAAKVLEIYGYPEAGDWVTFSKAQKIIGRSAGWIHQQFQEHSVVPETRLDSSRRPGDHYDIAAIRMIKEYADTLDAGSMLSVNDIIDITKRSRTWVVSQLKSIGAQPERRFNARGHFVDHYHEAVIDEMKKATR